MHLHLGVNFETLENWLVYYISLLFINIIFKSIEWYYIEYVIKIWCNSWK